MISQDFRDEEEDMGFILRYMEFCIIGNPGRKWFLLDLYYLLVLHIGDTFFLIFKPYPWKTEIANIFIYLFIKNNFKQQF